MKLRRVVVIVCAVLLGLSVLPASAEEGSCLVEGTISTNGNPASDGSEVSCHHSGGVYETVVDNSLPSGNYVCEVEPGTVSLEVAGVCGAGSGPLTCPDLCDGDTCETVTCNLNVSGCAHPCASLAVLLPPVWMRRRSRQSPSVM